MDDSRSSEVFSDSAELSSREPALMDEISVRKLVQNTKDALSKDVATESQNSSFTQQFGIILEDCVSCVYQLLTKLSSHLDDPNLEFTDLIHTMEEIINILQLLCNFMKNVADAVTMTCKDMKTFPVYTGQILHAIFTHCKESQTTYGFHLKTLEQQLKDLFRSCHELHLVYLVVLEKRFVFKLVEAEELDILIEALEINLEIGDIVTSLDLKTLSEHWKAYTAICERYSNYLLDRDVFQNCSACLCHIVRSNLKTADMEKDQALVRAIKVAGFSQKILSKMCLIFKRGVDRKLEDIIELLILIHMHDAAFLKHQQKPAQLTQLVSKYIVGGSDAVLVELLDDPVFINGLLEYDIGKLQEEDTILGYALLTVAVIKILVQKENPGLNDKWLGPGKNLVGWMFGILPYCHAYMNLDLEFVNQKGTKTCSLYEHLLTHVTALAAVLTSDQYTILERILYESVLGTCLYGGLFASDIWTLLARNLSDHHLTLSQIIHLSNIYKKLESHRMFQNSPQQVNLSQTIERLYKTVSKEDRSRIFNSLSLNKEDNRILWSVFKIRNFPAQIRMGCEERVVSELNHLMGKLNSSNQMSGEEIRCLMKTMKQASTCSFQANIDAIAITETWLKLCPKSFNLLHSSEASWATELVRALQELTSAVMHHLQRDSGCVAKILHVISNLMPVCSQEIKLVLLKLVVHLALYNHQSDKIDSLLATIFKEMFRENDVIFKSKFFQRLRQHYRNKTVETLVSNVLKDDLEVKEQWETFLKEGTLNNTNATLLEQFKVTLALNYEHKCVTKTQVPSRENSEKFNENLSGNFEFAEIESVFVESDSDQPISKKAKLELSEVEELMSRIEKDVATLSDMTNVPVDYYRSRVAVVCDKLNWFVQ